MAFGHMRIGRECAHRLTQVPFYRADAVSVTPRKVLGTKDLQPWRRQLKAGPSTSVGMTN